MSLLPLLRRSGKARPARTFYWPQVGGRFFGVAAAVGTAVIALYALQLVVPHGWLKVCSVFAVAHMLAIAAAASGGFLGLLFGIPRMLQGNAAENETDLTHGATTRPGATQAETFGHNTNLEQISDWLTKILVGVGLTQLVELPDALSEVSQQIAPALGGKLVLGESNASGTIGVAIIIYFALVGFSYGYLWTRIYLPLQFHRAVLRARVERGIDLSPIQQKENAEDGRAAPKGGDDKKTI